MQDHVKAIQMRIRIAIFTLFLGLVAVHLCGCATTRNGIVGAQVGMIKQALAREEFDKCLEQIHSLLAKELTPLVQAEVLIMKGICLEELQNKQAAKACYQDIVNKFPNTRVADVASLRLAGAAGDQKERAVLSLGAEEWKVVGRVWTTNSFFRVYKPKDPGSFGRYSKLMIRSIDPSAGMLTGDELLARHQSDANLRGNQVEVVARSESQMIIKTVSRKRKVVLLEAICEGPQRFHFISFGCKQKNYSPELEEKWIRCLKAVEFTTPPTPAQPPLRT